MTRRLYRDEAVVLRTHRLGEADRIVVLLTRHHGQVRAVAKGVRRSSSRFGARLEPFSMVDVQLHAGRSLDVVTQVETIDPFSRAIAADYMMFTCATTMVEAAERLSTDDGDLGTEASPQQYLLLAGALAAMSRRRHAPGLVLDSYLLRCLALGGWAPSCYDCAVCAAPGPHRFFHVQTGGAVCESCRSAGAVEVEPGTMVLLGALLSGDWPVADASAPRQRSQASGLVSAYTTWHLERRLRSLALVERG
ncbi:DNA repair protein RecO [Actinomyces sp. 2119]|uniref:DNA repair protein RecO n=1 Tax=Actinomyces lilanjuaniae TaxID=2321394 RepID=A0ABM6Z3J7_9ACTO|nr:MULTISPECIES: DNA repair protein RecO [Actinomyces]AYD89915.1 DNA repair protein RecO [Actinomyces lilanjuaniae]RJF44909.1 DNA repair protein RecO [Actinomyces sp. 2119]